MTTLEDGYMLNKHDLSIIAKNVSRSKTNLEKIKKDLKVAKDAFSRIKVNNMLAYAGEILDAEPEGEEKERMKKAYNEVKNIDKEYAKSVKEVEQQAEWIESLLDLIQYMIKKEYIVLFNKETGTYWQDVTLDKVIIPEECNLACIQYMLRPNMPETTEKIKTCIEDMLKETISVLEKANKEM